MNENQQDNMSEKTTIEEQINDIPLSNNKPSNSKMTEKQNIINCKMFSCLKNHFNNFKAKYNACSSYCLLLTQFLIFVLIFSLLLFFSMFLLHYFGFERIFKFDYFFAVQNEYLDYLISDLDEIDFNLGSYEVKSQFEDIDNIYFLYQHQ